MLGDIIEKLEKLQDFVAQCAESGNFSLIDKDIIMQNLREIYLESSTISIFEQEQFDDDFNSGNSFIFEDNTKEIELKNTPEELSLEMVESSEQSVVSFSNEQEYIATILSPEEVINLKNELCNGDTQSFNILSRKLSKIEDLDSAMLYLHDTYPDKLNCQSVAILAEVLSQKML